MESPIGNVLIVVSDVGVRRIEFLTDSSSTSHLLLEHNANATGIQHEFLRHTSDELHQYFLGKRKAFSVPIDVAGTKFQTQAWNALSQIPYGATWSYSQQAHHIGRPRAVRAIGTANSKNPVAIVVPCHRVIGADGSLTGYAGGLDKKMWLLRHESQNS